MAERTNWLETDLVSRHLELAADEVGRSARANFADGMQASLHPDSTPESWPFYDSPLEVVWTIWWDAVCLSNGHADRLFHLDMQHEVQSGDRQFRIDFRVALIDSRLSEKLRSTGLLWPKIAVELDGHAFHEKTREQAAYRNMRDRYLQVDGWKVFHFSYSEMTESPVQRVLDVFNFAVATYNDLWEAVFKSERGARLSQATIDALEQMDGGPEQS